MRIGDGVGHGIARWREPEPGWIADDDGGVAGGAGPVEGLEVAPEVVGGYGIVKCWWVRSYSDWDEEKERISVLTNPNFKPESDTRTPTVEPTRQTAQHQLPIPPTRFHNLRKTLSRSASVNGRPARMNHHRFAPPPAPDSPLVDCIRPAISRDPSA